MKSVVEIASAVARRALKAEAVVDECLEAIERNNARVNAFVHLDAAAARAQARALDARIARGEKAGPLAGVAFGIKDIRESCAGMPRRRCCRPVWNRV